MSSSTLSHVSQSSVAPLRLLSCAMNNGNEGPLVCPLFSQNSLFRKLHIFCIFQETYEARQRAYHRQKIEDKWSCEAHENAICILTEDEQHLTLSPRDTEEWLDGIVSVFEYGTVNSWADQHISVKDCILLQARQIISSRIFAGVLFGIVTMEA